MNIEINRPELEAMIQQRMASGRFQSVEEVLMDALQYSPDEDKKQPAKSPKKQNLSDFLMESPLRGSGLKIERLQDGPRPIKL